MILAKFNSERFHGKVHAKSPKGCLECKRLQLPIYEHTYRGHVFCVWIALVSLPVAECQIKQTLEGICIIAWKQHKTIGLVTPMINSAWWLSETGEVLPEGAVNSAGVPKPYFSGFALQLQQAKLMILWTLQHGVCGTDSAQKRQLRVPESVPMSRRGAVSPAKLQSHTGTSGLHC